jgi:8-oxo-dGTP pyrophosphatase MutT (NUDIX family)
MTWNADQAFSDLARALGQRPLRPLELPPAQFRESAVLVPFWVDRGVPQLVFTQRPATLRHHAGQISFPGGARDEGDGTALFTALRELEEELGIPPTQVEVLGPLDEIPVPSGFRVSPFAGRLRDDSVPRPNPAEVEALLVLPVSGFFAPGLPRIERRTLFGRGGDVYFYAVGPHVIWGATAHILRGLLLEMAALPAWKSWTAA